MQLLLTVVALFSLGVELQALLFRSELELICQESYFAFVLENCLSIQYCF